MDISTGLDGMEDVDHKEEGETNQTTQPNSMK